MSHSSSVSPLEDTGGCDSGCGCSGTTASASVVRAQDMPTATINGVALHAAGQRPEAGELRELAYAELLRQRAVALELLPQHAGPMAPELSEAERQILETMDDGEVSSPQPQEDECRRYHQAHAPEFTVGQALHVRHILFAVTPGINVQALAVHAERALLELTHKDTPPSRFAERAAELSNCPTSTQGGDLGWIGPDDCAPELAKALFHQTHNQSGVGVHPTLVHSRFGFHIIEVLERRAGTEPTYEEVRERIARLLAMQSRARALYQYMALLAGEAELENIVLDAADSPLVQ